MVAVRDVVIPLALWASQEKEVVLFRPGESREGGPGQRGEGGGWGQAEHCPTMPHLQDHSSPQWCLLEGSVKKEVMYGECRPPPQREAS